MTTSTLYACPSCSNGCAANAHFCPSCGHVFDDQVRIRPGDGWSMTIFWGIMLAWIIPTLLSIVLVVILFILGVFGSAALIHLAEPSASPTPAERR